MHFRFVKLLFKELLMKNCPFMYQTHLKSCRNFIEILMILIEQQKFQLKLICVNPKKLLLISIFLPLLGRLTNSISAPASAKLFCSTNRPLQNSQIQNILSRTGVSWAQLTLCLPSGCRIFKSSNANSSRKGR